MGEKKDYIVSGEWDNDGINNRSIAAAELGEFAIRMEYRVVQLRQFSEDRYSVWAYIQAESEDDAISEFNTIAHDQVSPYSVNYILTGVARDLLDVTRLDRVPFLGFAIKEGGVCGIALAVDEFDAACQAKAYLAKQILRLHGNNDYEEG